MNFETFGHRTALHALAYTMTNEPTRREWYNEQRADQPRSS